MSVKYAGASCQGVMKLGLDYVHITSIYVPHLNIFVLLPMTGYTTFNIWVSFPPTSLFQREPITKLILIIHIIYQNWSPNYVQFRPVKIFGIGYNQQELWTVKVLDSTTCGPIFFFPKNLPCYISKHVSLLSRA